MLIWIILHLQRGLLLRVLKTDTVIYDTNMNMSMNINMHIGTRNKTNTSSHIHIDIGTSTNNHAHIHTKTSTNNSAMTNVHTNTGDLSLPHCPITQSAFSPKGSSWEGGGSMYTISAYGYRGNGKENGNYYLGLGIFQKLLSSIGETGSWTGVNKQRCVA